MPDIFPSRLAIHHYHSNYNTISLFMWTEEMQQKLYYVPTAKTELHLQPGASRGRNESVSLGFRMLLILLQWALGLHLLPQTKEIHDGWPDNQPNTFHTCHYTSSSRKINRSKEQSILPKILYYLKKNVCYLSTNQLNWKFLAPFFNVLI